MGVPHCHLEHGVFIAIYSLLFQEAKVAVEKIFLIQA
jgi:hypothetical protein